jgi:hypothetical protein
MYSGWRVDSRLEGYSCFTQDRVPEIVVVMGLLVNPSFDATWAMFKSGWVGIRGLSRERRDLGTFDR